MRAKPAVHLRSLWALACLGALGACAAGGGREYQALVQQSVPAPAQAALQSPADAAAPALSDEQSFEAVSARETIESDRARIEALRAQYVVIAPQPLPARTGTGPNIVAYALAATNSPGEPRYRRLNPLRAQLAERACARFASPDLAQQAFLQAGGPERDPRSLDPDGDGFACGWDPAPFRAAVN